uniref:PNPLA domain-containing protein n=1 Tax=Elaeophora elaphi TaxID=1147741 RepID=A0A0R3RLS1_9BILA
MTASGVRIMSADPARVHKASLSLSGCGFLCMYHAGVCAAIKEYAPQLLQNQISGASAGSIIAAGVICDVCISQAASIFLSVVFEARSYTFGALNRDFDLMKLVRIKLEAMLPSNAHELCTGRLRISVTRSSDMKNVILDEFRTKDELIDAICCSCFIPVYGGFVYPTFRNEVYIDGGASDNQPVVDTDTITVSPFSGESDICPTDEESASLFDWNFAGTSIRLTANNLYRAALCLFPPSAEECVSMCRLGFSDALKYLISNGFTSVESDLSTDLNQINEVLDAALSSSCAMCQERNCGEILAFDEVMKKNWFLDYIRSFRIVQLAHYITLPLTATYQWFKFCQCLSIWLAVRITKCIADDWQSMKVQHIIDFILNEIHAQETKVSARLSQQLAITEVEFTGADQRLVVGEEFNISLSSEAIEEREALRSIDRLLSKAALSSVKVCGLLT